MNWSLLVVGEVPEPVVSVRSTVPADPLGAVAAQLVVDEQSTDVAAVWPKLAVVDPTTNPLPVTLTTVPPPRGPATGVIPVTSGGSVKLRVVNADGPPLLDMVWPVKTCDVEVPAPSVTVKEAV